jgi:hypothetical protein
MRRPAAPPFVLSEEYFWPQVTAEPSSTFVAEMPVWQGSIYEEPLVFERVQVKPAGWPELMEETFACRLETVCADVLFGIIKRGERSALNNRAFFIL